MDNLNSSTVQALLAQLLLDHSCEVVAAFSALCVELLF